MLVSTYHNAQFRNPEDYNVNWMTWFTTFSSIVCLKNRQQFPVTRIPQVCACLWHTHTHTHTYTQSHMSRAVEESCHYKSFVQTENEIFTVEYKCQRIYIILHQNKQNSVQNSSDSWGKKHSSTTDLILDNKLNYLFSPNKYTNMSRSTPITPCRS
jgi:hypothetical protein